MDEIIRDIVEVLRAGEAVDDRDLVRIIHAQLRRDGGDKRQYAKRRLMPFYLRVKQEEPDRWAAWDISPDIERRLLAALRMKPRRTASGVATITVITKPWPCSGDCLFCPNDIRMPKSYLHGEPACERAEQNWFDPYLQVAARLTALSQMGHATDKIELIVLGGTWSDYPEAYQIWFVSELFRALNDAAVHPGFNSRAAKASEGAGDRLPDGVPERIAWYRAHGFPEGERAHAAFSGVAQAEVDAGRAGYNAAVRGLYAASAPHVLLSSQQSAAWDDLERLHRENESSSHRVVGLVIETRPDAVSAAALTRIRRLGATKVQMGVQSLDQRVLDLNRRHAKVAQIERAFALLRLFGFKIHAHQMLNLLGSTPDADRADYRRLMTDPAFLPDEVKLYPCALIESARLRACYEDGSWVPYPEEELLALLADDILATPSFCRISRMIRDFSSDDIRAGNKKPNLRQLVEERIAGSGGAVREIRYREVGTADVDIDGLELRDHAYVTAVSEERFLEWVDPAGRIAGFLRLSLPDARAMRDLAEDLPIGPDEAMIREVHVYGAVARLGEGGRAAQHLGLGRRLVGRAVEIAREEGYRRLNVISSVGTRAYYRSLGFGDHGLYQQREL
ncbi:MAG: tRNA uridine(34) 5-carboxymethylaminomethyl modification radical SAM/GNAT enzyme Elp3 [Coriobacteriaceae bacterium]|nr:tRNA uridine(34) 5-carboxymethylaminomethyl modification radical SAM/GNAT enzyme Elp3 [Coriobacteriaceae bacterium]